MTNDVGLSPHNHDPHSPVVFIHHVHLCTFNRPWSWWLTDVAQGVLQNRHQLIWSLTVVRQVSFTVDFSHDREHGPDAFVPEVPKNSSQDRNLQGTVEQIPDDPVFEKAEQLVEVLETVSRNGVQQRTVEQIVDASVPQAMEELAEVSKVFSQDRIQERIVEQTILAISLAGTIVVVLVIQKPKIIEETVQRMKHTIQEKINQATKHIKIPQVQFWDEVDDMLVFVQRQVSTAQTVQKAMEVPLSQFTDKFVDKPVVAQRQISTVQIFQTNIEIPQFLIHWWGGWCPCHVGRVGSTSVGRGEDNRDPTVSGYTSKPWDEQTSFKEYLNYSLTIWAT